MIKLGDYNKMTVVKEVDFGLYLDGGDEGEMLLPKRYVPEGTKPGDELEVFVYLDQEERPVATTEHPLCKVGDFAYLEVSWVNEYGAFLNWGLMKDLFCPFREQKKRMEKGQGYIVHVGIDEDSFEAESGTVGGWTVESFGTFPKVGDSFRYENLTVTVLEMDGRRVEKVLVKADEPKEE